MTRKITKSNQSEQRSDRGAKRSDRGGADGGGAGLHPYALCFLFVYKALLNRIII